MADEDRAQRPVVVHAPALERRTEVAPTLSTLHAPTSSMAVDCAEAGYIASDAADRFWRPTYRGRRS
jgi:hypothetical protein